MPTIEGELFSSGGTGTLRMKVVLDQSVDEVWSAITEPDRLAHWYGRVDGDLRVGGAFTAYVFMSEWDGQGRVEACDKPRHLEVSMWEEEPSGLVTVELQGNDPTTLVFESTGLPLEYLWAFGAGWHCHFDDLIAHLEGNDRIDFKAGEKERFDERGTLYETMLVTSLD